MSGYSVNNIFGNTSNNNSFSISDYNLIRTGAYKKLAKAYYTNEGSKTSTKTEEEKKADQKQLQLTSGDAKNLSSSIADLLKKDTFEKKSIADDKGNKSNAYDMNDIYKKAESFVKSYNAMLESGADSDNSSVLRAVSSMTGRTAANSKILSEIGIKVGKDNKLSIDEDAFKKADINKIKTMFSGSGSYASAIKSKAATVENAVAAALNKKSTYTSAGSYNASNLNSLYEGLM